MGIATISFIWARTRSAAMLFARCCVGAPPVHLSRAWSAAMLLSFLERLSERLDNALLDIVELLPPRLEQRGEVTLILVAELAFGALVVQPLEQMHVPRQWRVERRERIECREPFGSEVSGFGIVTNPRRVVAPERRAHSGELKIGIACDAQRIASRLQA